MKFKKIYSFPDRIKLISVMVVVLLLLWVIFRNDGINRKGDEKTTSLELLFEVALEPVGHTMYIWGGGWDTEEKSAGTGASRIGVSPKWKTFAASQDADYDYEKHRFERENGLDCSGYVGWVIYNLFEEKNGKKGYVTTSTDMAESFAAQGWGKLIKDPKEFLPGDIVSMDGHVWISLGTCQDGSVLLIHSSPPGVSICGTQINEGETSIAIDLAQEYMETNYPKWQEKYPNRIVPSSYLENVSVMRWSGQIMNDAKKYQSLNGEELLAILQN